MSSPIRLTFDPYKDHLGAGSYAYVAKATERDTGDVIALKMVRVSLRVSRTILRHEARVLQHLQGHRAIPKLLGYGRELHFDYIAMELLAECLWDKIGENTGVVLQLGTVARIGEQMLFALEHLEMHSIVHRDIKPDNILLCRTDPTRIVLVDFGIAYHNPRCAKSKQGLDNALQEVRYVCGSPYWCSVRAHKGLVPSPEDDLESLSFVLLHLSLGDLPWDSAVPSEGGPPARIRAAKERLTSSAYYRLAPVEFAAVLESARQPNAACQINAITATLRTQMRRLSASHGEVEHAPLDWTTKPMTDQHLVAGPDSGLESGEAQAADDGRLAGSRHSQDEAREVYENSYSGLDVETWHLTYARPRSLTFPPDEAEVLDGQIPDIAEVKKVYSW